MSSEQHAVRPPDAGLGAAGGDISAGAPGAAAAEPERPGDPPCLLRRVCPDCGAVAEHDPPTVCPQCGAELTGT